MTRVTREARRGKSSRQPGSERPKRCRHRSATRTSASEKWPVNLPQLGLGLGLDVRQGEVAREPAAVRAAKVRMVVGACAGLVRGGAPQAAVLAQQSLEVAQVSGHEALGELLARQLAPQRLGAEDRAGGWGRG